jgi:hypothetical protein
MHAAIHRHPSIGPNWYATAQGAPPASPEAIAGGAFQNGNGSAGMSNPFEAARQLKNSLRKAREDGIQAHIVLSKGARRRANAPPTARRPRKVRAEGKGLKNAEHAPDHVRARVIARAYNARFLEESAQGQMPSWTLIGGTGHL